MGADLVRVAQLRAIVIQKEGERVDVGEYRLLYLASLAGEGAGYSSGGG
jgi:hypothetical protein